jgi:hypothetical protein
MAPALALAFTEYVDEYVDEVTEELDEWGIPTGEVPDEPTAPGDPTAPAPGDPAAPTAPGGPATKTKKDYAPYGGEGTTFFVTSSPASAPVTIDGYEAGVTPAYFTDLPPGRHAVTVGTVSDQVELRPGGVTHLDVVYAPPAEEDDDRAMAGNYVDNRDNYFELHIGDQ